jgi:exodeoxyribonuclease VII large subunit
MSTPFPPDGVKVHTIGELSRAVKGLLEEAFPVVWVSGEVSNLARPSSGHLYLTLKDAESQLRTVIYICPVRVQGDGAAEQIAAAIRMLNQLDGIDVLIVGRGGGSLEDLWAFNEECVAQAIFGSRIPVVSGVGHETDLTIADLVADVRALTPSEAAERVVPNRHEMAEGLRAQAVRLETLLQRQLELARRRIDDLASRRCFRLPLEGIRAEERRVDDWGERLQRSGQQWLDRLRQLLESQAARLESLSPLNVLARGYSLTRREGDPAVVRSPEQVRSGDRLVTQVQQGRIISRVE